MNDAAVSSSLVEHALALIAGAEVEHPDRAKQLREELQQWRAVAQAHEQAYEQAQRQWQTLGTVGAELRTRFGEQTSSRARRKSRTRTTLIVTAFVLCIGGILGWQMKQPTFDRVYTTGTAQLIQASLPDGSRVDVNAKSALQVTLYRGQRTVELRHGEARFEVATDASRPFRVRTRDGVVEVVGTAFTVADRGNAVTVEVEHGRVRFLSGEKSSGDESAIMLNGGERLSIRHGMPGEVEPVREREFAAWRDGWLVFNNERLADVVPAINAFRAAPIEIADDRTGALRLTGRFRAADSKSLLEVLPKILPVKVTQQPDGSSRIEAP